MTATTGTDLSYDPYDFEIDADPYPVWRRLRDEAPLYYNEQYDFYALSRFDDVERGLVDWRRPTARAKGAILEMIKADIEMPPGHRSSSRTRPTHDVHRGLLSRVFTPKQMHAHRAEGPRVLRRAASTRSSARAASTSSPTSARRCRCARSACCSASPKQDQEAIRDRIDAEPAHRRRASRCRCRGDAIVEQATMFADYIDWRAEHPSDDLMTELLSAEFEDETGTDAPAHARRGAHATSTLIAGAGNETTTRLIGWTGKVLAEHPDQRRELVDDRVARPERDRGAAPLRGAVAGAGPLRDRATSSTTARRCPTGSVMLLLIGVGQPRRPPASPTATASTSTATIDHHLTFGYGIHFCLGAALGPPRRPGRARRGAAALPRVGGRLGRRRAGAAPRPCAAGRRCRSPSRDGGRAVRDPRRRRGPRRPARPAGADALPRPDRRTRAGSTGSRSTTCASWSSTGATTYDWRAQEARLNELAHFRTDDRRPVDPLRPRALAARRRAPAAAHARLARLDRRVPRRDPAPDRPGGARRQRGRRVPRDRAVAARLRLLGADAHARLGRLRASRARSSS